MDMFKSMNHFRKNLFTPATDESSNSDTKSSLFHQEYHISKTTMQRYKVTTQPIHGYIPVLTIIHPTTKVDNPFDVWEN